MTLSGSDQSIEIFWGTYETFMAAAEKHYGSNSNLKGKLVLSAGLGGMGGAQPLAVSMAGGVSKATLPTMAGMVAALSGSFATIYLTSTSKRHETELNQIIKRDI